MPLPPKHYRFTLPTQWQSGIADRLSSSEAGLQATTGLMVEWLAGSNKADSQAILALDPLDNLYWLRPSSLELMRLWHGSILRVGTLTLNVDPQTWQPDKLIIGHNRLWLLIRNNSQSASQPARLLRYVADTLQALDEAVLTPPILDIVGDGTDGVWVLQKRDGDAAARLQRLSPGGKSRATWSLIDKEKQAIPLLNGRLTINAQHDALFVLRTDPHSTETCKGTLLWSILRIPIQPCDHTATPLFSLPIQPYQLCQLETPAFTPHLMTMTPDNKLYLFGTDAAHPAAHSPTLLWILEQNGQTLNQITNLDPNYTACVSDNQQWVANAAGIGKLIANDKTLASTEKSASTYITPTLVSPDGVQSGWLRAELAVDFAQGTAIEISVASTRDPLLIEEMHELFTNAQHAATVRLLRVNARLPWAQTRTIIYQGLNWPAGQVVSFPLQGITDTHLWLRIRIHSVAGAIPPTLKSLRVYYPDISYLRHLPAVYQENPAATDMLKRLLAVMESLLGNLDAQLDALPANIHPDTAPETWLSYLLGWLGLPAATELSTAEQRALLQAAPALLKERGTAAALTHLLTILVGKRADGNDAFTLSDNSNAPTPWTLPTPGNTAYRPRLGCDTLVLVQQQPGFYLGTTSCLGKQPLGFGVLDPRTLFARTSGMVTIRIGIRAEEKERLEPLLRRYLPYFIPVHCRYVLNFVSPDALHHYPLLNDQLLLHDAPPPRLGTDTTAGCMRLEAGQGAGITLSRSTLRDNGPYLT